MSIPKFSIIIPVYKVEQYLHRCIDSILAQTFIDFELLLINDGSPDASGSICDKYAKKDTRVRVFHKENGGVSSARNLGLDNAKGEWVAFVDSDDWVDEQWLQMYATNLKADIVFQGVNIIEKKRCKKVQLIVGIASNKERAQLVSYLENTPGSILNSTWSKCMNLKLIQENNLRFDESCCLSEDLIFALEFICISNSIATIEHCGYYYIRDNSTLTKSFINPYTLINIKKKILQSAEKTNLNCNPNSVIRAIAIKEYNHLAFYTTNYISKLKYNERAALYDLLRTLRAYIDRDDILWSRSIYKLLYIPNKCFDPINFVFSTTYNTLRKIKNRVCNTSM